MNLQFLRNLGILGLIALPLAGQEPLPTGAATPGVHVVQSGETLFGLARRYRVTVGAIEAANGLRPGGILRVGASLRIPTAEVAASSATVPAPAPAPQVASGRGSDWSGTHVVQAGETLGRIAKSHGTTPQALAEANGLANPDRIAPGQRLRVPGAGASAPESVPPAAVAAATPTPPAPPASQEPEVAAARAQPEETYHYYDVQPGDTLAKIASMFFTTTGEVARLNNIPETATIKAGQQLVVPTRRYFEELRKQGDVG
jgi:LysM repeat protein